MLHQGRAAPGRRRAGRSSSSSQWHLFTSITRCIFPRGPVSLLAPRLVRLLSGGRRRRCWRRVLRLREHFCRQRGRDERCAAEKHVATSARDAFERPDPRDKSSLPALPSDTLIGRKLLLNQTPTSAPFMSGCPSLVSPQRFVGDFDLIVVSICSVWPQVSDPLHSQSAQGSSRMLIGLGSPRRSASQAIDLPSDGGVNLGRLFTVSPTRAAGLARCNSAQSR